MAVSRNMKQPYLILIATIIFLTAHSQSVIDFSKFPVQQNDTTTLRTADLLDKINWQAIKNYCKSAQGHYVSENKDSFLTIYNYVKQGYEASFEIVSYAGTILEYNVDAGNGKQHTSYFNKTVWLEYVSKMLPSLPDKFKLTKEEPNKILKAYYSLLGVDTRDEYGFICEYSTVGMATQRRVAIIELLRQHRFDLIKRLIDYPNLQTKLYAIDALIYQDYTAKETIKNLEYATKTNQNQLDRLQKKNGDKSKIQDLKTQIQLLSDSISNAKTSMLTNTEWKMIYELRDSNQTVKTCGNMGSYKIYGTPISELLSDKAIDIIPKKYEGLGMLGYFK